MKLQKNHKLNLRYFLHIVNNVGNTGNKGNKIIFVNCVRTSWQYFDLLKFQLNI